MNKLCTVPAFRHLKPLCMQTGGRALRQFENYWSNTDTHQNVFEINTTVERIVAAWFLQRSETTARRSRKCIVLYRIGERFVLVLSDHLCGPSGAEGFFQERGGREGCTRWYPMRVYYLASGGSGRGVGSAENIGLVWGHQKLKTEKSSQSLSTMNAL